MLLAACWENTWCSPMPRFGSASWVSRVFTWRVTSLLGNIDSVRIIVMVIISTRRQSCVCVSAGDDDTGVMCQTGLRKSNCTHHEGVLHSDDAAVQDGGWHRWDLQHLAAPGLSFARGQRLSPQVGHQLLDLLRLPFGIEGLGLVDGCLWHHHAGWAVLDLCKDLDWLSCRVQEGRRRGELEFIYVSVNCNHLFNSGFNDVMSSDLRSVVLSRTYLVNGWLIRLSNTLLIINVVSPGVYPFLSILALREIGPEVQNQQQSVLSFVPACGDWRKKTTAALANYPHIPHHNQWKWSIMMSMPLLSCRPCGNRSKPDYTFHFDTQSMLKVSQGCLKKTHQQ